MSENKFLNKKTTIVAVGAVAAYLIYKQMSSSKAKEGMPEGSLGGEDDLEGQQGFDIDPNSPIPQDYTPRESYYYVQPDGTIQPSATPTSPQGDTSGIPSTTPTYSSGTGSLVTDAAVLGGALGFNALLPNLGKGIKGAIDSKYAFKSTGDVAAESNFQKWLKDPYNIGESAQSKILREGEQGALSVAQAGEKPLIREAGGEIIQTVPKWAKGVKGVANFIPLLDIPIGAGLDVYFSKYEEDPSKKIDWWTALQANTAGELAQLGVTGGAAAAGTVVPVAGNIAGGVGGFIVGTGADIAATEAVYKAKGKSSLFDFGSSSTPQSTYKAPTAAQAQTVAKLTGQASYNFSTNTYTSSSGSQMSMSPQNYLTSLASSSSSSSGGSSKSSSSSAQSKAPAQNMSVAPKTSTSSSAQSSSSAKTSAPSTQTSIASKIGSVASAAKSAVTSTVSKITSIFKGKKK